MPQQRKLRTDLTTIEFNSTEINEMLIQYVKDNYFPHWNGDDGTLEVDLDTSGQLPTLTIRMNEHRVIE
jgi:stress response protein SCP2